MAITKVKHVGAAPTLSTEASYERYRNRIETERIIEHVNDFALGRRDMSRNQLAAGIALLKKTLPDLATVQHTNSSGSGPIDQEITIKFVRPGDVAAVQEALTSDD